MKIINICNRGPMHPYIYTMTVKGSIPFPVLNTNFFFYIYFKYKKEQKSTLLHVVYFQWKFALHQRYFLDRILA